MSQIKSEVLESCELKNEVIEGVSEVVTSDIKVEVKEEGEGVKEEVLEGVVKPEIEVVIKEECLEEQIKVLLDYAHANNDPAAALKVLQLEYMILERDAKIKDECVKQELEVCESLPTRPPKLDDCLAVGRLGDRPGTSNIVNTHSVEVPIQYDQNNDSFEEESDQRDLEEEDFEEVEIDSGKSKMRARPKIHQCEYCSYQARSPSCLKVHRRKHTGEKPFSCNVCEYRTTNKGDLKKHEATHSFIKPFSCTVCEFRTARKGDLKVHKRTHLKEKRYTCSQCSYRATRQTSLKKHALIHSQKYSCTDCPFKTLSQIAFEKHSKTHSVTRAFRCTICFYRGPRQIDLIVHTSKKHPDYYNQ